MSNGNTGEVRVVEFRRDMQELLRNRVREPIQITLEEELADALGCGDMEASLDAGTTSLP